MVLPKSKALRSSKTPAISPISIVSHLLVAIGAFQLGMLASSCNNDAVLPKQQADGLRGGAADCVCDDINNKSPADSKLFPDTFSDVFVGASLVGRDEFSSKHDLGVPYDPSTTGNEEVLILYSSASSLPSKYSDTKARHRLQTLPTSEALENCNVLKVILTQPKKERQCMAIMGQWESYHIHKLMRANDVKVDASLDLTYVARGRKDDGGMVGSRSGDATHDYWSILVDYLSKLDATIEKLKPIAQKAAGDGENKAIVVMTCNWGQAALLFNFVCSARSRGLDLSRVLLFATDEQTGELGKSLGLNVFDVGDAFGEMPEGAAKRYGDKSFKGMMMAKVYCVHLITVLGYDLLFQDVDMIWRRNPLDYFYSPESGDFDIYFQDDGARSPRYAPYSPNTGFYFVRNNDRTEFFFNTFVRMGDLIQASGSHQSALTSIMSEQASWRGLKVKVFGRDAEDGNLFPGGFHYHKRKDFMMSMMKGEVTPYIFHMSWTKNKGKSIRSLC